MILSHILLYGRSKILYGIYFLIHSIRGKLHHCQTAKTWSTLCVISVVRLIKNATEGIDLDASSLLLPDTRWLLLNDGRGWKRGVRDEALRRSSKEATFSQPFYLLKGIQYRVYKIFEGQIINTKGLRNLRQWQQLEGSVNTHGKKRCLVFESVTQKLEARKEGLERAVLRLIERESINSIMQEMTQQVDDKREHDRFAAKLHRESSHFQFNNACLNTEKCPLRPWR